LCFGGHEGVPKSPLSLSLQHIHAHYRCPSITVVGSPTTGAHCRRALRQCRSEGQGASPARPPFAGLEPVHVPHPLASSQGSEAMLAGGARGLAASPNTQDVPERRRGRFLLTLARRRPATATRRIAGVLTWVGRWQAQVAWGLGARGRRARNWDASRKMGTFAKTVAVSLPH
jgi:hypothetical protein